MILFSQFCDLSNIIYPKKSFRSTDAYHKLCHARFLTNYHPSSCLKDEETNHVEKVVSHFFQKAEELAEQQLKELKQKHWKN